MHTHVRSHPHAVCVSESYTYNQIAGTQIGAERHELWSADLQPNFPTHLCVTSLTPCEEIQNTGNGINTAC